MQPQEAFDELLKYLFYKQYREDQGWDANGQARLFESAGSSSQPGTATSEIRARFSEYLAEANSWSAYLWADRLIHLSDMALAAVHQEFELIRFREIGLDIRSQALREFLSPELRRGLGIYLTPEDVVRMAIRHMKPSTGHRVLDPACGSGTFLIEAVQYASKGSYDQAQVYGIDRNPRMLLLAELNLGHVERTSFHRRLADSLDPVELSHRDYDWPLASSFDMVFTNPPFGVVKHLSAAERGYFTTAEASGRPQMPSEVLFLEQCLRFLKPGGKLCIVLPRSVLTNRTLRSSRVAIGALGYVTTAVSLPPETFSLTGTQTATWLLFMTRYSEGEDPTQLVRPVVAEISNVGHDSTGRPIDGNQLIDLDDLLVAASSNQSSANYVKRLEPVAKSDSLLSLVVPNREHLRTSLKGDSICLADLVDAARTGYTPSRSSYTDSGLFLVKVGNLTGSGIDWQPRQRNFIANSKKHRSLLLQRGDILLTSSAHHVDYIAKKVDIVWEIPHEVGGEASFTGEVLMLRPKSEGLDPFALLAFLRIPETAKMIQRMVSGQTAHLMPDDLLSLPVPRWVMCQSDDALNLVEALKQEQHRSLELSKTRFLLQSLYRKLSL